MNIYDDAINELRRRGVMDAEIFAPYFIISYACHAFNLVNERSLAASNGIRAIYMISGQLPNLRNHLLFMAPPGTGKTFIMKQFINKFFGLFKHTPHQIHQEGSITEAGLIGTIKVEADGSTTTLPGAAHDHQYSVFVIDEFMAIMNAMKSGFNAQLEAQLLTALDSGDVSKRLAHGAIDYHTAFTMWCGIQPIKASLEGGLGRRFCYLLNIPSIDDQDRYAEAAMTSDNIEVDPEWIKGYRRRIELWNASLDLIERIEFHPEFYDFLRQVIKCKGFEVDIYRRLALGYHLSKYGASEQVCVRLDETIRNILIQQAEWRYRITQGPRVQQIIHVIRNDGYQMEHGFGMTKAEIIARGGDLQLSAQMANDIIKEAASHGFVKIRGNNVCLEPAALLDSPVIQRAKDRGFIPQEDNQPTIPEPQMEMDMDTLKTKPSIYEQWKNDDTWDEFDLNELREYAEENHDYR